MMNKRIIIESIIVAALALAIIFAVGRFTMHMYDQGTIKPNQINKRK